VSVPSSDPETLRVVVAEGILARWHGVAVPLRTSLAGIAIKERRTVVVDNPAVDSRTDWAATTRPIGDVGQTMAVPMSGGDDVLGVLVVSRRPGDTAFDQLDRELVAAASAQAGLALRSPVR
jgi:two-component system, NarL family, sensor histidine kinase DevS